MSWGNKANAGSPFLLPQFAPCGVPLLPNECPMFDSIRSHRRWLMLFLVVLVFPSFVFFGVQGYNRFMEADRAVAKVGGQSITPQEFDAAQRQRLERMREMFGQNFDPKLFDTPQARASVLDSLMAEKAVAQETAKNNVFISPERVIEVIKAIPQFQVDGKFNYERYKVLLGAQGQSEQLFEQRVRADLVQQTLLRALADSSFTPRTLADDVQRLAEEEREIRELRFRVEDFLSQVKVSDAAINDYYTANKSEFETPETVRAEYVVLTLDSVASQITAPEADLRAYYEQNKSRYGRDEERRASHILFTVGEGGTAKDKDATRKVAQEVLAKVRANPDDFAKLAKQYSKDPGSAANGGDLGFFGRNMMVKPFEEAAYKLKQGEISDLVESDFGFHIIRLTEIKPAQVKPFEEVKAEIENEYRRQQAQKKFAEAAETFTNTVYEQSDSLKPVAEKLKLQIQVADNVTRQGLPPRPNAPQVFVPRLVEALFAPDAIKNSRNTEAIETGPSTLASARVVEHRPAALRPLDQVREQIRVRVERAEATRLAKEAGEKKLAELAKSASDAGFSKPRTVSRSRAENLPQGAVKAIMRAPTDKLPTYVGSDLDGGAYGVFQVLSAKMPAQIDAARKEQLARDLQQTLGAGDDAAYVEALKMKYKAEVLRADLKVEKTPPPATK
jgi:peptidyl-prolyl cis-trans isomerase D